MGDKLEIEYYVYLHTKATDGTPFYIGKGCGPRAYRETYRSDWWTKTVDKYGYDVIILKDNLTEDEAFKMEIDMIVKYGRRDLGLGTLVNMTNGGDGASGYKWTQEQKDYMSDINTGKVFSDKTKMKMSKSHKGLNTWMKGKILSNETKKKMSESSLGKGVGKGKIVLDVSTGIYYLTLTEAAKAFDFSTNTLSRYLNGVRKNKTTLRYV